MEFAEPHPHHDVLPSAGPDSFEQYLWEIENDVE